MLTDAAIRRIKLPAGKRFVRKYDGNGLFIYRTKRKLTWRVRFTLHGKERWITLGEYPYISLAQARAEAARIQADARNGIHPRIRKHGAPTMQEVAEEWFASVSKDWVDRSIKRTRAWLIRDILPALGSMDISTITPQDVLALLKRIGASSPYKARRIHGVLSRIGAYAIAHGYANRNPAQELIISDLIPKHRTRHYPAITTKEGAAQLVRMIDGYDQPIVRGALKMLMLTLSRPGEVRAMRWAPSHDLFAADAVEAARRGPAAVIVKDGIPVVVGGVALAHPGVGVLWMWATPDFRRVVKTTARVARAFIDAARASGVHRVQATSRADYHEAHKWIRFFGLREECRLTAYGSDRSDYIIFAEVFDVHE